VKIKIESKNSISRKRRITECGGESINMKSGIPNSERKQIVFVGKRNVGKSSLINALLQQQLCIVDDTPGTTTDPVKKAFELLPYGPVVLIDTAGIDDTGILGEKRINKTVKEISNADFAVVVVNCCDRLIDKEKELLKYLEKMSIPHLIVVNKIEKGISIGLLNDLRQFPVLHFEVSCRENVGIDAFKRKMIRMLPENDSPELIKDVVHKGDLIILVVPIDLGAPKGRLILPQVQTIREALDGESTVIVTKETELKKTLSLLNKEPNLIVTDSQAIKLVAEIVPPNVPLTTFSILMARYKGDISVFVKGLKRIKELENGDKILIAEACSHHVQAEDIGTVKVPIWMKSFTGKDLIFEVRYGNDFPEDIENYKLIVHCGGCMITRNVMMGRIKLAKLMEVPIVNYGIIISYINGVFPRILSPFKEKNEWEEELNKIFA
jgi:[FeFe] hydrogenase H-cluster maturation GTPase HydF